MPTRVTGKVLFILFQLTIFSILALQLFALVKEYALPALRKQIALLKKSWVDLQQKHDSTVAAKEKATETIEEQTKTLKTLEQKVVEWYASRTSKLSAQNKRDQEVVAELKRKKRSQIESLELAKVKQTIVPKAIAQARAILESKYSEQEGKKLLEKVLKQLPVGTITKKRNLTDHDYYGK